MNTAPSALATYLTVDCIQPTRRITPLWRAFLALSWRKLWRDETCSGDQGMARLSLADLEQIQLEALADDVEIDLARMQLWSACEARAYFESGGAAVPAEAVPAEAPSDAPSDAPVDAPPSDASTAADPALAAFLALHGLGSLAPALAGDSPAG